VSPELFGHDLEFTRHDLFNGISAEMLANHKFSTLPPTAAPGWPAAMTMLADAGVGGAPRWTGVGSAALDAPYWKNHSGLVNGDVGHSVRCDEGDVPCGVEQRGWLGGFNSGKSFGSSIALEAGKAYVLRLVLRGAGNGSDSVPVSLSSANYFEPVNEGAIAVTAGNAALTPVGEAMALYARHAGGSLVAVPITINGAGGSSSVSVSDVDVVATRAADGRALVVTLAGLDATWPGPAAVTLALPASVAGGGGGTAAVTTLASTGFDPASTFDRTEGKAGVASSGAVRVQLPAFSVVQVVVPID